MNISEQTFKNAKRGDQFVGKNKLTWTVIGTGFGGALLCESPHTGNNEVISFQDGKIVDSENWRIEEFEDEGKHIPA